jgi:hypothetical protein
MTPLSCGITLILIGLASFVVMPISSVAQPLANPYTFAVDHDVDLDSSLLALPSEVAGSKGRVILTNDGHLGFADGSRLRLVGTTLQWFSIFPDSANAITIARRLKALGINCVRLNTFDVSAWPPVSIFRSGTNTTLQDGLDPVQMAKFDWFMHQLRQHGIFYVFTFQSTWTPRAGDGVLQPDSTGWGARVPLLFNRRIQQIHRDVMRAMLTHVNEFTKLAYKDDPALAYVIAAEDASPIAFWLYTNDIIRPNPTAASTSTGIQHVAYVDSLWNAWLENTYKTDAVLASAWQSTPKSTQNIIQNGDFEDPFSAAWVLNINTTTGAQALFQFSDADKQQGASSGRVRINKIDPTKASYMIQLVQRLPVMRHLQTYELSYWAKTTPQRKSREVFLYVFNGTSPYNSYGLAQTVSITSEWKKYSYTFTSTVTDSTTPALGFFMGSDSGDVYLDDVQLREANKGGMRSGESLTKKNIRMSSMLDGEITVGRSKDNARFVYENFRSMLTNVRRMVRDTLKSQVLLCPTSRLVGFYELDAVREYDVFSSVEWLSDANTVSANPYGGYLYGHAQVRPKGKAFVMSHASVQFPRAYASELMAHYPAYAGLQDWDGVFFSVYSDNGRVGSISVDSNDAWMLRNKPNIVSMFPWTASLIRRGAVEPSPKELVIEHTAESVTLPRFHMQTPFGLSVSTDQRIPLFRRVSISQELKQQSSFLPHLEVSALAGDVDLAALDAENGQIYRDATKGIMRIETPTHAAVMGPLSGQIITMAGLSVEQTTAAPHALVAVASQTLKPFAESERSLLTISTRALNAGAAFDATNLNLTSWGKGPVQMEGVGVRVSITAPTFDSLIIRPLGQDGRPTGQVIGVGKRSGGRFTTLLNTAELKTPWYQMEFITSTSVDEEAEGQFLTVLGNPVVDGRAKLWVRGHCDEVQLVDLNGRVLQTVANAEGTIAFDVSRLATGCYRVIARQINGARDSELIVIQ